MKSHHLPENSNYINKLSFVLNAIVFAADLKINNPELIDLCARKCIINMGDV